MWLEILAVTLDERTIENLHVQRILENFQDDEMMGVNITCPLPYLALNP